MGGVLRRSGQFKLRLLATHMNLSALPSDIWGALSLPIGIFGLCNLMGTGNKALRQNLSRGIRQIEYYQLRLPPIILEQAATFQHLDSLILSSLLPVALPKHWISRLPPTIRTLSIPGPTDAISSEESFPPQLSYLKLAGNKDISNIIPRLPATLTTLETFSSFDSSLIPQLPPHLTHLQCAVEVGNTSIAQLGRALTHLDLSNTKALEDDCAAHLPPNLTYLRLESPSISPAFLLLLPRTIKKLILADSNLLDASIFALLPPNLQSLKVPRYTFSNLTDQQFKAIPAALTDVDLSEADLLTKSILDLIPNNLVAQPALLPDHLREPLISRYLPLVGDKFRVPSWLVPSMRILDTWTLLPSTLTNLDLGGIFDSCFHGQTTSPLALLPSSLRSLRLDYVNTLSEADFGALPRGLTLLRAVSLKSLSDDAVRLLPAHLTCLELGAVNKNLTGACAKLLPRTLQIFIAGKNECFTSETIVDLPRRLEVLDLGWSKTFDDSAVPHLPPLLKDLRLNHTPLLTDTSLPHFPPNLTFLDLSQSAKLSHAALSKAFSNNIFLTLPYGRALSDPW